MSHTKDPMLTAGTIEAREWSEGLTREAPSPLGSATEMSKPLREKRRQKARIYSEASVQLLGEGESNGKVTIAFFKHLDSSQCIEKPLKSISFGFWKSYRPKQHSPGGCKHIKRRRKEEEEEKHRKIMAWI